MFWSVLIESKISLLEDIRKKYCYTVAALLMNNIKIMKFLNVSRKVWIILRGWQAWPNAVPEKKIGKLFGIQMDMTIIDKWMYISNDNKHNYPLQIKIISWKTWTNQSWYKYPKLLRTCLGTGIIISVIEWLC